MKQIDEAVTNENLHRIQVNMAGAKIVHCRNNAVGISKRNAAGRVEAPSTMGLKRFSVTMLATVEKLI